MDYVYQHPVFFECHSLCAEQKRKLEMYFRIRRRSGGGECGPLRRVRENVYSVAFKHQKDQQRVLEKSHHELADASLVFIVRDSVEPHASSTVTTSTPSQDFIARAQRPHSVPGSSPPTSGEEYELHPDAFILHYLNNCPKALNKLNEELTTVACSAQIDPEEGRVLVWSLAQPGAADESKNWKSEVDRIFDDYMCHYEVDPHKAKALLQSSSSQQSTDEVKVYDEGGVAVVVGKHSQVNARLMDVENSTVEHRGSCLGEKKTSVHWLGETKLCLLWKEIKQGLGQDFPGVKVSQGDAGQLLLEGFVEEICDALAWVSDKEKFVLERTVSDMSPHLLTFLRKAYGDPGVLGDVLEISDEVVIELRDRELCFFSISADKLDNAEKTLQDEFKEVKINVPNCSALSSELWEKLKSRTYEINQGRCRAQAVFTSDSTLYLLGHTKEVEELSEMVTQFILDQSIVQSTFPLPFPVLAQELPELLQLHGFDHSGVVFHPSASSTETTVVLEGPSSKVTDISNRLGSFLDSLIQDKLTTDAMGSVNYFRRPIGIDRVSGVGNSHSPYQYYKSTHHVEPLTLSEGSIIIGTYSLCGGLQVLVCQGDITKLEADALVNAANEDLNHCGGVAAALSKAGGPEVQKESKALVKQTGKVPTGDVVVTTGGKLKCKTLLHAVGPVGGNADGRQRFLLEKTVKSALNLAEMMEYKSIAMPCISSGVSGAPVTVCSEAIVTAVKEFGSQGGRSLSTIILIDNREEVVTAMREACDRLLQGISTENGTPSDLKSHAAAAPPNTARGATAGAARDGVRVEIVQGTIETQQVDAVVSPMVGHDPLSTRVGNTLAKIVGSQLTARFRKEAEKETLPGDTVLVEGLSGLPSHAVFFLNLIPWDEDPDGTAVQVLRLGMNTILTSCEERGFQSVALPVLGAGIALRFPDSVVARVLLEEVHAFEESRASRTPLLVRVAIHPNDRESSEVFQSAQEAFTKDFFQPDQGSTTKRMVLLGKTGAGKSNLANTIFGENIFTTNHSPNSGTKVCQAETRLVNERSITLIDTPGLFDAGRSEEELKPEIVSCITECAPGPHAFLIVLKVEKFTEHEKAVITKICEYFSEDALKYAVIVFTHGEQLHKGTTIEDFVKQNKNLNDLVEKCGGRCHVFDNKYWKNRQQNNYRSNQFQLEALLNTVDKMVMENKGGYYTNEVLQAVEEEIKKEEEHIKQSSGNMQLEEIRKQAKTTVSNRFLIQLTGTATGVLLGAFLGLAVMVGLVVTAVRNAEVVKILKSLTPVGRAATAAVGGEVALATGVAVGVTTVAVAATGGVLGGVVGHDAAEGAETVQEAAQMATKAVIEKGKSYLKLH